MPMLEITVSREEAQALADECGEQPLTTPTFRRFLRKKGFSSTRIERVLEAIGLAQGPLIRKNDRRSPPKIRTNLANEK